MTLPEQLIAEAQELIEQLTAQNLMLATAESCTAGMIAATLADISGASAVLERGFVTYSNEAKMEMLGVSGATLERFGAVSQPTAEEMARGAFARSRADVAVSVTGIAGPTGGSAEKPVGLVHFAVMTAERQLHLEERYGALERLEIRQRAVLSAFALVRQVVSAD